MTGGIPAELGSLSNLGSLNLSLNDLVGAIPVELSNLSNLISLTLSRNRLTGAVPAELGRLSNLRSLNLQLNQLTGKIPVELGNLSNLKGMSLSRNRLTGEIPAELGSLSNLETLWLGSNQLTGVLPQSFMGLTALESLRFLDNPRLCAPIDEAFQAWLQSVSAVFGSSCAPVDSSKDRAVLAEFYRATGGENWGSNANWLSDRPIREWYGVTNDANGRVDGLILGGNGLTGGIPAELGSLSNLQWLLLWGNGLTGEIPAELGNLSNLRWLYLRNNRLTGCIPAELQNVESNDFDRVGLPFCVGAPGVSATTTGTPIVRLRTAIPVTVTFSEPVSGFTVDDVTVANGSAGNFSGSDSDAVYTFDVTPSAIGAVTVDIAAGVAEDNEGNGNTAAPQLSLGIPYDDNDDGGIQRDEVIEAIKDYFADRVSRDEVIEVIKLYFSG